jgi:hypothetical protein
MEGGGGVKPAGEGNADFLADGQGFENYGHACGPLRESSFWLIVVSDQFSVVSDHLD